MLISCSIENALNRIACLHNKPVAYSFSHCIQQEMDWQMGVVRSDTRTLCFRLFHWPMNLWSRRDIKCLDFDTNSCTYKKQVAWLQKLSITVPTAYSRINIKRIIFYCAGDKIETIGMGGAYSAYRGGERRVQGFGVETWGQETTEETQA